MTIAPTDPNLHLLHCYESDNFYKCTKLITLLAILCIYYPVFPLIRFYIRV